MVGSEFHILNSQVAPRLRAYQEHRAAILARLPQVELAEPILTGSMAHGTACPHSDWDIVFVGDQSCAQEVIRQMQEQGLKVRARLLESQRLWTSGAGIWDAVALLGARAVFPKNERQIQEQQKLILQNHDSGRNLLRRKIREEQNRRHSDFEKKGNLLPNLKYSPGGIRDIEQVLLLAKLFPEKFCELDGLLADLSQIREQLVYFRFLLHSVLASDQITPDRWSDIAGDLRADLNSEVLWPRYILRLLTASHHAVMVLSEAVWRAQPTVTAVAHKSLRSLPQALNWLTTRNSKLVAFRIRTFLDKSQALINATSVTSVGVVVRRLIQVEKNFEFWELVFRSGIMGCILPRLNEIRGEPQFDAYHRWTVDRHIEKTLEYFLSVLKKPRKLNGLKFLVHDLTPVDVEILFWSCLFHDIGKCSQQDHSRLGSQIAKENLVRIKAPLRVTIEVAWLVEHHLTLSRAAFRDNPDSPETWEKLSRQGVRGGRLKRLALLTCVDIMASNPDAWTPWKNQLLTSLVEVMTEGTGLRFDQFYSAIENHRQADELLPLVKQMDLQMLHSVGVKILVRDLINLVQATSDIQPLWVRHSYQRYWLRLHSTRDELGLFRRWVSQLHAVGLNIEMAAVHSFDDFGAYDWFLVSSSLSLNSIKKRFRVAAIDMESRRQKFREIRLEEVSGTQATIVFKAHDSPGLLLSAAQALAECEFNILWARVHTWGKTCEDIFGVSAISDLSGKFNRLKAIWQF